MKIKERRSWERIGRTQRKILSCLFAGVSIGLSRSPRRQWRILTSDLPKEFARINMQSAEYGLHRLYKARYIGFYKKDGDVYFPYLTKEGRELAKEYSLDEIVIHTPKHWDGFWRLVMFDIPEKFKKKREALRFHLYRIGFRKINKSVFAFPYECGREIMEIVEYLRIQKFICYVVAREISREPELRFSFGL